MPSGNRGLVVRRIGLASALITAMLVGKALHDTLSDPIVRRAEVTLPGLAPHGAPLRLLVMSDMHVAGPDMPPKRLRRIVAQVNALRPDYVLITGDLISDRNLASRHYPLAEAIAPLAGLQPRIGVAAVLGNHDHWRNAALAQRELTKAGAIVLRNQAVRIGPLTVGGIDDDFSGHANTGATVAAMRRLGPPYVVISHSPDPFPDLPKDVTLMLAGHTHCGQIRLPLIGAPAHMSRYGNRYACGRIEEGTQTLFVTAGLGTSVLPFRFGVSPDVWLVTIRSAS
ncbi:metallophosphoesterase [Novosphingobium sp.]|uniref:metallophosphoesterase n=1 Tax=Novosphingobium sp. TaxID=1874826 RepID=UPI0025F822FD|nr:metallophosphoesterase [Novosphingobium sp.]